ncbi:MAG: DUF3108 domain-containing protein [Candidatus Krumholzibacteria bacterium]|nr:DUF3108 domain-containing protein [Candidatus Krumholzibacteria bacterium]
MSAALACAPLLAAHAHAAELAPERYTYLAHPRQDDSPDKREVTTAEIVTREAETIYRYDIRAADWRETGWIATGPGAVFRAAWREVWEDGALEEADTLYVEGARLVVERRTGGEVRVKAIDLPAGKPVAVDASALLFFRQLPLESPEKHEVFMVDFSQHTVNVDVRSRGLETVVVPAGTFGCYHLEVTVKVFVFRPKIHFWVTAEPPHFLVRHQGKRGPFTASFTTELTEIGGIGATGGDE